MHQEQAQLLLVEGGELRRRLGGNLQLLLFVEQEAATLQTPAGRDQLRQAALEATRRVMKELTGESWIDELYFTSFYVQ